MLDPDYDSEILKTAQDEDMPAVKKFFRLYSNQEVQLLTDGDDYVSVGVGSTDHIDDSHADFWQKYTWMRAHTLKPLYLIHNHPNAPDKVNDLPSPNDAAFWREYQSIVIPAIYDNTTDTILSFNQLDSLEAQGSPGLRKDRRGLARDEDPRDSYYSWSELA